MYARIFGSTEGPWPDALAGTIASFVDCCPTCLSAGPTPLPDDVVSIRDHVCPTCRESSPEWTLISQIDGTVRELLGIHRLTLALLDE